jgi:hypothetical protein
VAHDIACWKCGASLAALGLPFGRSESCRACGADLHCCRLCRHHDPRAVQQCRVDGIDEVRQKDRANFCDHYQPVAGAFQGSAGEDAAARALAELERLFGKG